MEMLPLDRARWPFIALLASAAMLGAAQIVETFFHYAPCQMCWWQRYVYWAAAALALLSIAANWGGARPGLMRASCVLLGLVFLTGVVIAGWHSLVEWKVLPPLSGCVASGRIEVNDDLWSKLGKPIGVPSCADAPFRIIWLSMAGWNVLASLALAAASFLAAMRPMRTDTNNEPVKLGEEANAEA